MGLPEKDNSCEQGKCKCIRMCYVLGICVFRHALAEGSKLHILALLRCVKDENVKTRRILNFFHEKQPPKFPCKKNNPQIVLDAQIKATRIGRYKESEEERPVKNQAILSIYQEVIASKPAESNQSFFQRVLSDPGENFHE